MRCEHMYERVELSESDHSMFEIRLREGWSISKIAEESHTVGGAVWLQSVEANSIHGQ